MSESASRAPSDHSDEPGVGEPVGDGAPCMREDRLVAVLEATSRYRVLRCLPTLPALDPGSTLPEGVVAGLVLDVETTGLDPASDEVIELAMVRFAYRRQDGVVMGTMGSFQGMTQPTKAIPAAVTRLTGIDDAAVAGKRIDPAAIVALARGCRLVVAHNAGFDRGFAEAAWPFLADLPWACSCTDVDWAAAGYEGAKLSHLLMQAGFFHDAHRALGDAMATLNLLALPLPGAGRTGLAALLDRARTPCVRVWGERAPFEARATLRSRGYRWCDGSLGLPRAWHRDLAEGAVEAEIGYLRRDVYGDPGARPLTVPVAARDRFTVRAGAP